jgi:hypothetical protein
MKLFSWKWMVNWRKEEENVQIKSVLSTNKWRKFYSEFLLNRCFHWNNTFGFHVKNMASEKGLNIKSTIIEGSLYNTHSKSNINFAIYRIDLIKCAF